MDLLRSGQVSAGQESVAIQVAQLLGRYHGCCIDNAQYNTPEYRERFSNEEHVAFFKSNFVAPVRRRPWRVGGGRTYLLAHIQASLT